MSLEKIAKAIEGRERSQSLPGRVARGLGTLGATGAGYALGAVGGAAGGIGATILTKGRLPIAVLHGSSLGGALGGAGAGFALGRYKKDESAQKYRTMQGILAGPPGAVVGNLIGRSEDEKERVGKK